MESNLHWRILRNESPNNYEQCIVGRISKHGVRASMLTFSFNGREAFWVHKNGNSVKCNDNDHWCPVSCIIQQVEDKVVEEIEWELEKNKLSDCRKNYYF